MAKTVVVVDDSSFLVKQIVEFFVKELKYEVIATGKDGYDAVELYKKHQPDLLTLDITMPNKNGEQALDEILTEFPNANTLMISAVRGDAILACMDRGAKGYIEKPLKFKNSEFVEDFIETVKEIFKE